MYSIKLKHIEFQNFISLYSISLDIGPSAPIPVSAPLLAALRMLKLLWEHDAELRSISSSACIWALP